MINKTYIFILLLSLSATVFAQQTPAPKQEGTITIKGGIAHIGNGEVLENSLIVIKNGKISEIGEASPGASAAKGKVIDATGKHIYPGLIALNTTLGLVEIGAVRATQDEDELGEYNPHIEAIIAYNAESKVVESMRPNGVLMAQVVPQGGSISGESSVVQLDAWNWEDAVIKRGDGIHLNWPNSFSRGRWWLGEDPGYSPNKDYSEDVAKIQKFFNEAKAYDGTAVRNLEFEAMATVFSGDQNLYIDVDGAKEILDIIDFADKNDLDNVVLMGASQAHKIAEQIAEAGFSIILERVHSLPGDDDEGYDVPFVMAKTLMEAGVTVALGNDSEFWQSRNIPFYAGQLTAYGVSFEDALKLITSNAAEILGIEEDFGTLEAGKSATFFISEGNALEMMGNRLSEAFINGRNISLESHQTELWKRYMNKYEREGEE
ncbi:MAG: amidohydrolase family protein [Leeuwenhoekiella sp.]